MIRFRQPFARSRDFIVVQPRPILSLTRLFPLLISLLSGGMATRLTAEQFGPFTYSSDGAAITITRYTGTGGVVVIPDTIAGLPVRTIGAGAFNNTRPTSVTIPDSVTSIGDSAFIRCTTLASVTIGNGVTSIGAQAFYQLSALHTVNLGSSVQSIGTYAFRECVSLGSVTIPDSVTSLGLEAFRSCTGMTSLTIGNGVTSLAGAFVACTSLTSVTLGNSVTSLAGQFVNCANLTSLTIPNSVTSIDGAFQGCTRLASLIIPDGVTSIGNFTFNNCTSLASVSIGTGVTSIGLQAFRSCKRLTSVRIPGSVNSITNFAFEGCTSLSTAIFEGNAPSFGANVFIYTARDFAVYYFAGSTGFTSPTWQGYRAVPVAGGPYIVTQPASRIVPNGSSAALSILAVGKPDLSFHWYLGESGDTSQPVAGATSASYNTPVLTTATRYWVRATDSLGTADSETTLVSMSAPVTWRYFRFVTLQTRQPPASPVQLAEFSFRHGGSVVPALSVTNPAGNNPAGGSPSNLLDGALNTKWQDTNKAPLVFDFGEPVTVDTYTFVTANDIPDRDPVSWRLDGSDDGAIWTTLSQRTRVGVPVARLTTAGPFGISGGNLPVANDSFEDPALAAGTGQAGPAPGWTGSQSVVQRVTNFAADGVNHHRANIGSSIWQELPDAWLPLSTYVLVVSAGHRPPVLTTPLTSPFDRSVLNLESTSDPVGTSLAAASLNASLLPVSTFADVTLTYTTGATPPAGRVRIRLATEGPATPNAASGSHFDNIRLSVLTRIPSQQEDAFPLVLNQRMNGAITDGSSADRWIFSATVGQQVQLKTINASAPGLIYRLQGPGGWTGFIGSSDSGLITLPSSGQYTLTVFSGEGSPASYAFRLNETTQTLLPVGTLHTSELSGSGEARLFRIDVTESGPLNLSFLNAGAGNRVELYASRGAPPTRGSFEHGDASGPGANRSLTISHATAGTWYILVYGDIVLTPGSFSIQVSSPGVSLTNVAPTRHAASAPFSLTVTGTGFGPGMVVELVSSTGSVLAAESVAVDSFTQLTANFAASDTSPGSYSLRVQQTDGDTATLPYAFEILAPGASRLETRLIMPAALARRGVATIYVEYANTGNAAMPAPLLALRSADPDGSDEALLTLNQNRLAQGFWFPWGADPPPGTSPQVLFLASGALPGVLNPGERLQVPVYYLGRQEFGGVIDGGVELEIRYWTGDDPTPLDWAEQREALRPPTLDAATWNVVYANLTSGLGTTADYVHMLSDNARFLSRFGLRVVDLEELWNFEVQQAYGYSALPVLEEVTDSSVAAPGVTLDLTRRFSSNLRSRHSSGPFGQGWFTPWQARLLVESGGDLVKLVGEAGSARTFSRDSRNEGYFSDAGDSSKLVASGAGYQLQESNGTITRFRADGRIGYVEDTNGNRVTAAYNGAGNIQSLTHSSGGSITITYNGAGLVESVSNSAGRSVTYTYDGAYLALTTTDDGKVTGYNYEIAGPPARRHALTSVTRGGVTRHFTWDDRGRLASSSLAAGEQMTIFGYDTAGGVTVTAGGGTTALFFEHHGLLARMVDPLGNVTSSEFDIDLRLRRLVLPTGDSRSFTWCACGNPTSVTDELGHTTRFKYDHPFKRMTRFTDAKGNVTSYTHDARGNLLETTYADGSVERLSGYTAAGLASTRTNRRGQAIQYTYTASGRIDREIFADGHYNDFDYDARGNLMQVTEHPVAGPDKITAYTYDPAADGNRLKKVTYPNARWVEYFYDEHGRRSRLTDSAGGDTSYEYDPAGRLWSVRDAIDTVLAEYLYDSAGRLLRINKGNGTYTTFDYDASGQILQLINYAPDGAPNSQFIYTYDARGLRTNMDTLDGKWTYAYDATGQLIRAVFDSSNAEITDQDLQYNYDALGNRTSTVLNGVTTAYTTNNLNQYITVGGAAHLHDADGNLISDGEITYAYDAENRLVQVNGSEGVTQYEYDALGNRTASVKNGHRTEYLLDPTGLINVIAEQESFAPGPSRFTHGLGLVFSDSLGRSAWFDFDVIGSTVGVSGSDGTQTGNAAYLPFGGTFFSTLDTSIGARFVGQFGVVTRKQEPMFMRARYYLDEFGHFSSADPLRIGANDPNINRYVANNPISLVDYNGLWSIEVSGSVGVGPAVSLGTNVGPGGWTVTVGAGIGLGASAGAGVSTSTGPGFGWTVAGGVGPVGISVTGTGDSEVVDASLTVGVGVGAFLGPTWAFCLAFCDDGAGGGGSGVGGSSVGRKVPNDRCESSETPSWRDDGELLDFEDFVIVAAFDPNEKLGPAGYGEQSWIQADALMPYRINFENLGPGSRDAAGNPFPNPATAPAQRVTVIDPLPASLDWNTFRFTEFGFGDTIVPVPNGSSHFNGSVSMTFNGQTFDVEIQAGINFATGVVSVVFQSINPATSLPPDVLTGFLPPEDGTGRGKGHVAFTVRSRTDLPTGTEIRNVAQIRFDVNEVITTDQVNPQDPSQGIDPNKQALVTLDADVPDSTVEDLPAETPTVEFPVSWSGTDAGSGIANYDIYFSDDGGAWELWQARTTAPSAVFHGEAGHTYGFFSVARDNSGNVQATPTAAQASTTVMLQQPVVSNLSAQSVTARTATLSGVVNPASFSTSAFFEITPVGQPWPAAGELPAVQGTIPAGAPDTAVSAPVSGLTPHTSYRFRLTAENAAERAVSPEATFTTANTPPAFSGYSFGVKKGQSVQIEKVKILARASDADGDTLTLTESSATSAQGGSVSIGASSIGYTPPPGFTGEDSFSVTISDGFGGDTPGTVNVNVTDEIAPSLNFAGLSFEPDGSVSLRYYGIPGRSYTLHRSVNLLIWQVVQSAEAAADGRLSFTDPAPPVTGGSFYRTRETAP